MATRPQTLYRFFSRSGVLLYIGITGDPATRWKDHSKVKHWWPQVRTIEIDHYPDRDAVVKAEATAIAAERPLYNIVHNRSAVIDPRCPTCRVLPPRGVRRGYVQDILELESLGTHGLSVKEAAVALFGDEPNAAEVEKARRRLDEHVATGRLVRRDGSRGGGADRRPALYFLGARSEPSHPTTGRSTT